MLKKRLAAFVAGIVLVVAVAAASTGVAGTVVGWATPAPQAIACNSGGHGGGGC